MALVPWIYFSSSLTGGATSILGSGDMVKKIYFPREVMPIAYMTSSFVNMLLQFSGCIRSSDCDRLWGQSRGYALFADYYDCGIYTWTGDCTSDFCTDGVSARSCVYSEYYCHGLAVLTPVMYSQEMVLDALASYPTLVRIWNLNPMTPVINAYRDILYYKTTPQLSTLAAAVVLGVGILPIGELVFVKLQKGFAEEL